MNDIQYVNIKRGTRIIHVETKLGIVNIHVGLTDMKGRNVETVSIIPDDYPGEKVVKLVGNRRLVELKNSKVKRG